MDTPAITKASNTKRNRMVKRKNNFLKESELNNRTKHLDNFLPRDLNKPLNKSKNLMKFYSQNRKAIEKNNKVRGTKMLKKNFKIEN